MWYSTGLTARFGSGLRHVFPSKSLPSSQSNLSDTRGFRTPYHRASLGSMAWHSLFPPFPFPLLILCSSFLPICAWIVFSSVSHAQSPRQAFSAACNVHVHAKRTNLQWSVMSMAQRPPSRCRTCPKSFREDALCLGRGCNRARAMPDLLPLNPTPCQASTLHYRCRGSITHLTSPHCRF